MRRLYISIICAVLGAIFAMGWGLDLLVDGQEHISERENIATYQRIIDGAANQLAATSPTNIGQATQTLANNFTVTMALEQRNNVQLPPSLAAQLSQPGGLLLASPSGSYLLRNITNHANILLQLQLPGFKEESQHGDLLLTMTLYLGVCLIIILWSLPLTRRLYLLNNTAAKFGAGEFSARLPQSRFSYIHLLERSFNRMATQIENLLADNKILARSLSHDIRTPIACLRFGIEAALDSNSIEKKNSYLNRMDSEITRMEQMTSAFLEYAGLERQMGSLTLQTVNLNQWLCVVCDELTQFAAQQNVVISVTPSNSDISYAIDGQWFHRAMQNLLSNAVDFAQSKVVVLLTLRQHKIIIHIIDDGPGIAPNNIVKIFEPFVRSGDNRSREQGHFGLGLAITSKVITWHGGTIQASNDKTTGGACFTLTLPIMTV
ncbi:MAG: two-component sensor histidine kinase [Psychrobium sp.]|nr:two-component sensor histidine kinase [Psychrobium sp.]